MALQDWLHSANGKVRLKTGLLNPKTKTLQLQTGKESGYLALDIDDPYHPNNRALLKLINRNDLIVRPSNYTLDDVFAGRCRYKVIYEYQGKHIPAKKQNKAIEIFYQKTKFVAIAGKRDDGHEYKFSGKVSYIHFDVNDVLEVQVPFSLIEKVSHETNETEKEEKHEEVPQMVEGDEVSIDEFKSIAGHFIDTLPVIKQKENTLLTFECLFPHTHTSKNYGYAFKKNGVYVAKCQGEACSDEYYNLNKQMSEYALNKLHFDNVDGFGTQEDGVNVFIAPTGWGKTEKIAEEVLIAVNENKKLLILLQNKESINRLLDRVDYKSGGRLNQLEEFNRIYIYTSENKDETFKERVNQANVIISHHYYFKNAGDVLTYFPSSHYILQQKKLEVIVDEAHSYIELASRLDLEIGGAYDLRTFNGKSIYLHNSASLTREQAIERENLTTLSACVEGYLSDFGTITLQKQHKVYKDVEYIDILKEIKKTMTLKQRFDEGNYRYLIYNNPKPEPIKANALEDTGNALDLLLKPSEHLVVAINMGDDVPRRRIGDITLTIYHSQNLEQLLQKPKKIIMTTATLNTYHEEILGRYCDYNLIKIEDDIKKVGKIVLLRSNDKKSYRIRNKVLETVNDLNSRSLLFFPTISKAKAVLSKYENVMLNDNGYYVIGKRKHSNDFIDNMERNVTLAGLESSVAKGYNYLEEIDDVSHGFELIYFDNTPVSPQIVKKYINDNDELQDYENDYNISIFAQAIGRALRKQKETLTIGFNSIDDYTYEMIKAYIKGYTNAEVIEDDLNITNIKLSISSYIRQQDEEDLQNRFRNNDLFQKLYGGTDEDNDVSR